jgi:predicted dehydrogenase
VKDKVNIAVIGLGNISQLIHLPLISKLNNVQLTAISDSNKTILKSISEKYQIKSAYLDYKKLLENEDIHAAIIATPTYTHSSIAKDFIQRGTNIFVERPLSVSSIEAEHIFKEADKKNVLVFEGMNMRYRQDVMLLKSIILSGDLGKVLFIKSRWFRNKNSNNNWISKKEYTGCGVIYDLGVVLLDLSLWLLNYPQAIAVTANNYLVSHEVEDVSISMIRCNPNILIQIESSWSFTSGNESFSLEVFGTNGNAELNPFRVFRKVGNKKIDLSSTFSDNILNLNKKSYTNQLKHFIGAIKNQNQNISKLHESILNIKIIEAMYESALNNIEVRI